MGNNKIEKLKLAPITDLAELLAGLELVNIGTNFSANDVYLLAVTDSTEFRTKGPGPTFSKVKSDTAFPLVRIQKNKFLKGWNVPIAGSHGFILWRNLVMFRGGYGKQDQYFLFELQDKGSIKQLKKIKLLNERGKMLKSNFVTTRGSVLYLIQNQKLYKLDLRDHF